MRWVVFALALIACTDQSQVSSDAPSTAQGASTDTPLPAVAVANASEFLHAWQDPTCETDTVSAHADADALVREYVARNDSLGYFADGGEDNDEWYLDATECPGHLGGTDGVSVVMQYTINRLIAGSDTARYVVQYDIAGYAGPDSTAAWRFEPAPGLGLDSLLLVRTPFGWRIAGQPLGIFMAPAAVARQLSLPAEDRARLDSLTQVRGASLRRGA